MRKNLVLIIALALALLPACSRKPAAPAPPAPGQQPGPPPSASGPQKGGILRVAVPTTPTGYVLVQAGGLSDAVIDKLMFNSLTRYDPQDLTVKPNLATSWEASDGARTWTFKLRQGVKWHDGAEFTADDVKFTYDAIMNPKVRAKIKGNLGNLKKVEVIDKYTVRFLYDEPFAPLPTMVGYNAGIVPKHLLEGKDLNNPADFLKKPIGTGPFKFKAAVEGSYWELEANKDYWDGAPHLDGTQLKVVGDVNALVAQIKSGDIDLAMIQPKNVAALQGDPRVNISTAKQVNFFYLSLSGKDPILQDVKVRRALNYAVDKKAIIDAVLRGQGQVATGPISPVISWAYTDEVTRYPYDVERAKRLLADAGWKPGSDGILRKDGQRFTLTLTTSKAVLDGEQLATVLDQQLKQVGIDTKIQLVEFGELWVGWFAGKFQADVEYLVTPPDPDLFNAIGCKGSQNRFFYCNQRVDDLIAQARAKATPAERAPIYKEIQRLVADDPPGVFLYYPLEVRAVSKRLQGFPGIDFRNAFFYANQFWLQR